jgi:hypothetical protein
MRCVSSRIKSEFADISQFQASFSTMNLRQTRRAGVAKLLATRPPLAGRGDYQELRTQVVGKGEGLSPIVPSTVIDQPPPGSGVSVPV